ncbi:MAG: restriction endonuclease subunit S [Nitrospirae bacterium]|nr:restriction endonuclease subunit S [Nitrospirota bacterium]
MIDINPNHLETVKRILAEHVPDCEVRAYGSRVTWTAKDYSDLDLAVVGTQPLESRTLHRLKEAFEESDLPFRVDVLDWHRIHESFRKEIEKHFEVVSKGVNKSRDMAGEWTTVSYSEAVSVNPRVELKRGQDYPFVDMQAINQSSRCVHSSESRLFEGGGARFVTGDTLMARITPCLENGKIARFCAEPETAAHGSTEFIVIRGRDGITDTAFAYYLTKWEKVCGYAINQMTGTSGRQRVPTTALDHLSVSIPPLPEQQAIAHILGTLDDKIECLRRMNETLAAMARAIFKSWFVDFDPVRSKAQGRDSGLPKPIANLFPSEFENSELGEIPKGWYITTIRELSSNIQYGLTQSASTEPVGPRFLRITDIQGGRVDWGNVPYCFVSPEEHDRYHLKPHDILVARTGASTGENIYLPEVPEAVFASYLVRFHFEDPATARLVGAFMRTPAYFNFVAGNIGGSAQPNASAQVLARVRLVVPTSEVSKRFFEIVASLDKLISDNNENSRTMAAIRDALLPKLLSGEIRIMDAEKFVEASA